MAQASYLSPRPSAHPLQNRSGPSARTSTGFRPTQSPATPVPRPTHRRVASHTPRYASATATSTGRKRSRLEPTTRMEVEAQTSIATPQSELASSWGMTGCENSALRSDFASPEPFVNTRYHLDGGLDTPGLAREGRIEHQSQEELGIRRRWRASQDGSSPSLRPQYPSSMNGSPQAQQSWGQFVFAVAGKMWSFGTSAFKGFYAGGGQGYAMDTPAQQPQSRFGTSMWDSIQSEPPPRFGRDETPVPGSFPTDDDDEDERKIEQRPAKRMHVEGAESPWVMVEDPKEEDELQRKRTLHKPPPPLRAAASTRRSLVPVSRRSSDYASHSTPATLRQSASHARQRSSPNVAPIGKDSPLSPEAHKYLADRKRDERQQDASIRRMNEQLKSLLKEGRQALGTKVEVLHTSMDLEDEGYFEDGR